MATTSYRKAVNTVAPTQVQVQGGPRTTGKFDNLVLQLNKSKWDNIENINKNLLNIVMIEAEDNARVHGAERAQQDFAEIEKLESFRDGLADKSQASLDARTQMKEGIPEAPADMSMKEGIPVSSNQENADFYQAQIVSTDEKIKSLLKKGSQFNISERVRAENLNKMYLDKVNIDATATINDIFLANQHNPETFAKEASKILDNLGGVPEQFKSTVSFNIKNTIDQVKRKAQANLKIKQDDEITANRNTSLNLLNNTVTQNAFNGEETAQDVLKMQTIINDQIIDENITQVQGDKFMEQTALEVVSQKALGRYSKIITSSRTDIQKIKDGYKYAEDFLAKDNPMSQGKETEIYNKLRAKAKAFEVAIKAGNVGQAKIDASFLKKVVKRLTAGDTVGQTDIDKATKLAIKLEQTEALNFALVAIESVKEFQKLPPTSQEEYIAGLEDAIEIQDIQGKSTIDMYQQLDILKKKHVDNVKTSTKDPIGYVTKNPLDFGSGLYVPNKLSAFDGAIQKDEEGGPVYGKYIGAITNELGTRFRNKDYFKEFVGDYKSLSPDEVNLLNRRYSGMSRGDKSDFLVQMTKQVGFNETNKIFGEMWKKGASSSLMAASFYTKGGSDNIDISDNILRGQEIAKEKLISMDKDTKDTFNTNISNMVSKAGGAISGANLAIIKDTISDLYFGLVSDPDNVTDKAIMQDAVDKVTNGIIEYNGGMIFAPVAGMDTEATEDWINSITDIDNTYLEENNELPDGYTDWAEFKKDLRIEDDWGPFDNDSTLTLETVGTSKYRLKKDGRVLFNGDKQFVLNYMMPDEINEMKPDKPYEKTRWDVLVDKVGGYFAPDKEEVKKKADKAEALKQRVLKAREQRGN